MKINEVIVYPKGKIHYDGKPQPEVKKINERDPFKCVLEDSKYRESLGYGSFKYKKFRGCL